MTVTLDVNRSGDAAVLHGLDSEDALAHLCRSLITGSVFDTYPALIIDLGDAETDRQLAGDLRRAVEACLHRHQWLAVAHSGADVAGAVADARQWRRLVEREKAVDSALKLSRLWSLVVAAAGWRSPWILRGPSD